MKKILVTVLILISVFLVGCSQNNYIKQGASIKMIHEKYTPTVCFNFLSVFKIENKYKVVIYNGDVVKKTVDFSSDREYSDMHGLIPVKIENLKTYLNLSIDEIEKELGEPHADIGSGFYIPSYITDNGYMVRFRDDPVSFIEKVDLLTGESEIIK